MTSLHSHLDSRVNFKKWASTSGLFGTTQREAVQLADGLLDFLPLNCKFMLKSIVEIPFCELNVFFDSVKFELVTVDLVSLLKGLDLCGCWEKGLCLFEWFLGNVNACGAKLDSQAVEIMVKILGRESQHSITSKLFDEINAEDYTLDVRAYTTILHAHSRAGKYEQAIALFEHLKESGLSPTLVTYNVMLDVYGKMGRSWKKILSLLDEVRSKGLEFDEFTCSTVISACGREGLLEEAKIFFAGLKMQGYIPGTVTYNSLLQVFGKAGIYSEALSVIREMEENNCPPDSVTYNELVAAYVRAGFHEEGAAVIDSMTRKGVMPDAITYTTVIDAYGRVRKEDKALSLFNAMKKSGCVPNVCTYNAILAMLGKKSRSEEMMEILCDMKLNGCAPNRVTWNTMLAMCGNKGMHKYVNRVFREMKSCGFEPDRDTFNTLISAYGRCGSEINAAKMHEEMIQAGFTPCVTTYNALLNALARLGDWKAAESVILDMTSKGFKPNETSYSFMLHCYSKGNYSRGVDVIAKQIYDGRIFPSWRLLRTLVFANFKCRSLRGMERAFEEMNRHGYRADLTIFNSMISIYAKNKMYDRAHDMLQMIRENGLQPDLVTFNSLMDMYARTGECWKAEEILRGVHKPDLVSYNTVIKGFCRQGFMQEAIRVLSEMTVKGIRPCIVTYNTFIAGFASQGLFQEVNEVISYMIQHNGRPNELTYKIVIDGYCKAKKYSEALDFVARIRVTDSSFDEQILQRLTSLARENIMS